MRQACPAKMANEDAMATKRCDQLNVTAHGYTGALVTE